MIMTSQCLGFYDLKCYKLVEMVDISSKNKQVHESHTVHERQFHIRLQCCVLGGFHR